MRWLVPILLVACGAPPTPLERAYERAYTAQRQMPPYDGRTRCTPEAPAPLAWLASSVDADVTFGDSSTTRHAIDVRMHEQRHALRACYARELARDPSLEGRVLVEIFIGRRGLVDHVEVNGFHAGVDACVCSTVAAIELSADVELTTVRYPLIFSSGR